jgi:hypothetical protein
MTLKGAVISLAVLLITAYVVRPVVTQFVNELF